MTYVVDVKTYTTTCSIIFIVLNTVAIDLLVSYSLLLSMSLSLLLSLLSSSSSSLASSPLVWIDDRYDVVVVVRMNRHFVLAVQINHHFVVVVVVVVIVLFYLLSICVLF